MHFAVSPACTGADWARFLDNHGDIKVIHGCCPELEWHGAPRWRIKGRGEIIAMQGW